MRKYYLKLLIFLYAALLLSGCVYFNTYYNTKKYFSEAEKLRLNRTSESIGVNITDKYKKVIEKADKVISQHPKSRFVDDALFFKGRSHYYRREYELAQEAFLSLAANYSEDYQIDSDYWLALIKWKTGLPEVALGDLEQIIDKTDNQKLVADIAQAQAEIYLELKEDSLALPALAKAAELTKSRRDKAQIYIKLAELAFKIQDYEKAILYYENVIKYSIINDQIMDANLKIVQRYRDLNDLDKASSEIQSMLDDIEFSTIHGDLELELAKLKLTQNEPEAAISIFDEIVVKYPRSESAGEAFYHLGENALLNTRDFDKADFYFKQIQKEAPQSSFRETGNQRVNEIKKYNKSRKMVKNINSQISKIENSTDSKKISVIDTTKMVLALYNLGELEAFHFNQIDTSLIYFNQIIKDYPDVNLAGKTMFTLSHLYDQLGDSLQSKEYRDDIVHNFPDSEYAENIKSNYSDMGQYGASGFDLLTNVEQIYATDKKLGLEEYHNIANLRNSEASTRALLFIANEYDYNLFDADSAKKYYDLIVNRSPESEQADLARARIKILSLTIKKSNKSIKTVPTTSQVNEN